MMHSCIVMSLCPRLITTALSSHSVSNCVVLLAPATSVAGMPASPKDEIMKKHLYIRKSVLHDCIRYVAAAAFCLLHLLNRVLYPNGVALARRPALPFTRLSLHFVFCYFAGSAGATLCLCTSLNSSFAAIRRSMLYTASAFLLLLMQFW